MDEIIQRAVQLRRQQQYDESNAILKELVEWPEARGKAYLQLAWNCDVQGFEQQAIPYYQQALQGQLTEQERFDALLGVASSLRTVGQYDKAHEYFQQGLKEYPQRAELLPFYAMNLYNLGCSKQAVELLLSTLIKNTDNKNIKSYRAAIELYAEDLDRTW